MKKFLTCFWFHFKEAALTKTALIMAAISFVATVAIFGAIYWFGQRDNDVEIVVIQNSEVYTLDQSLLDIEGVNFTFKSYDELGEARAALEERDIRNIFIIEGTETPEITSIHKDSSHFESELLITQLIGQQHLAQVMAENEISMEVAEQLLTPIAVQNETLQDQEEAMRGTAISSIFGMVLYFLLIGCGHSIATNVVTEKSSRVMEIMISKVNPLYMMFAKILSVLAVMLFNIVSMIAAAGVAHVIGWVDVMTLLEGILSILDVQTIALGIIFIILGYFLYGMLFAAAGAMCSQVETMQSVISPITMAIMIPFLLPIWLPSYSPILSVASYIPFFSPFITFDRYVNGMAGLTEVGIVLGIMVVSTITLGKLATRIYSNGVMHYSEKVTFKDVKKLLQRQ